MARISFRMPSQIEESESRQWLEQAIAAGKPGPEFQAIRAHAPGVMRSFTMTRRWVYHEGFLEFELKELLRAYIALTGDCTYCSNQGVAREMRADQSQLDALFNYQTSPDYTPRQKLALRYTDAIMWDPSLADDTLWEELLAEFTEPELVEPRLLDRVHFRRTAMAEDPRLQPGSAASGDRGRRRTGRGSLRAHSERLTRHPVRIRSRGNLWSDSQPFAVTTHRSPV